MLTPAIVGVMFGLSVALPFGPVSLMCVQRTLADGLRSGLVAGAGAVTAQGIFALAALYGRDLVAAELALWSGPIRCFSALLLIGLGLRMLLRPNRQRATAAPARAQAAYGSTLALALSNPMTLLPYLGVASGTAAAGGAVGLFSSWSVAGVMVGAGAWYSVLIGGASLFRAVIVSGLTRHLNLIAGSMLIVFGSWVGLR